MQEPKQLAPIAEAAADSLQARQHTNRPSRLSAVLVPAPAPPGAHSPPSSSPTAAASSQARPCLPKCPSSEVLCKLDKQELTAGSLSACLAAKNCSPKPPATAPLRGSTTAISPPVQLATANVKAAPAAGKPAAAAATAPASLQAGSSHLIRGASGRTGSGPLSPNSFANSSEDGSEEEDFGSSDWGWDPRMPWYATPRKVAVVLLLLASVGLVLAGLVMQVVLKDSQEAIPDTYEEVYPWLYLFAAFPPLAMVLRWLCWRLYMVAEFTAIREELYFLRPLRSKLASLLFWMAILLWFQACFSWLWCHARCDEDAYKKALLIVWRLLICVTLFAAANFLKCSIARLLSYQFYRTAHFDKVKDAIERARGMDMDELYLIRLSQARSALLPPPPPPRAFSDQVEQLDGLSRRPGGWGSMAWRKTSQVFLGQHPAVPAARQASMQEPGTCQPTADAAGGVSDGLAAHVPGCSCATHSPAGDTAFAAACCMKEEGRPGAGGSLQAVSSAERIAEDAAVHVQVRQLNETALKQHQHQLQQAQAGTTAVTPGGDDESPLLQKQPLSCLASSPKVSWLQPGLHKAQQQHAQQQHQQQHQGDHPGRQQSYELFAADRVPSILGCMPPQGRQQHSSKTGSRVDSRSGSRVGQQMLRGRAGSRYSSSSAARRVSLPGMVAGVDGLLLQPDVLGNTTTADGQATRRAGQPVTEEELIQLRTRLGVNTFGTFVDRYYGMSPKEEEAHVRQVKRFAKGLFANVLGDADRDHILPEDFLLFFDGDVGSSHDAFAYFDRNGDGSISCTELQESAAEMLCERKNIAASIKDTDSVVNSLETGLGMLIHFIFIGLYLLVWGVNIVQGFTTFSATALALTFVFGDSVKGVFESALYLFVEHPYDVGDALWMPGNILARVKKIDLQFTVLLRSDGQLVWHPNSQLRTQPLVNLSRSQPRWEGYTWLVDIDTPDEVLSKLEAALAAHVAKERPHFSCNPAVTWRALEDPLKLRLAVGVTYSFTGEDARRYVAARHGILAVVRRELHRMGVKCTLPLQQQQQLLMPLQQPTSTSQQ